MQLPKYERMNILLKENPEGLTMQELVKQLNVKKNKDILNTINQLKHKGVSIEKDNGLYKLKGKEAPYKNELFNLLAANPDGLTIQEIVDKLNTTKNALSNRLWYLRRKGIEIVFENFKYKLTNKHSSDIKQNETKIIQNNSLIPKQYREVFLSLSDNDKTDCLDMLRKSLYYHKSALSLLESNKEVLSFISSIEECL
jgi:biotin operon repressor